MTFLKHRYTSTNLAQYVPKQASNEKGDSKSKRQHMDTRIQRNAKPENNLIHYIPKENKRFASDFR